MESVLLNSVNLPVLTTMDKDEFAIRNKGMTSTFLTTTEYRLNK